MVLSDQHKHRFDSDWHLFWFDCRIGIGFASMVMIGLCNIYYIILIAWTLFYLWSSFTTELPWTHCNNTWNTDDCVSHAMNISYPEAVSPVKEYWEWVFLIMLFLSFEKSIISSIRAVPCACVSSLLRSSIKPLRGYKLIITHKISRMCCQVLAKTKRISKTDPFPLHFIDNVWSSWWWWYSILLRMLFNWY